MSRMIRTNLSWALVVVFVAAAMLVPAAGARIGSVGPNGIQPMNPWYAHDAALRQAQHQRHEQIVAARLKAIQPKNPWYAFDAALRKAQQQQHRVAYRVITDTLGGDGGARTVAGH